MARLYTGVKVSAFGQGPTNEQAVQRGWLRGVRSTCLGIDDKAHELDCLRGYYAQRIDDLTVATLYSNPQFALGLMRKHNPDAAPLLEAIYLYAGEPVGADWNSPAMGGKRARLLALIDGDLKRLPSQYNGAMGILKDEGITSAQDALNSDKKFIEFVQMDSTLHSMPCAAVLRHPTLLDATDSVWGDGGDRGVINTDCEDTLPPVPQFTALERQLQKAWPDCDGSIKWSYYRSFHVTVDQALLATEADLKGEKIGAPMSRRKAISPADVNAAIADLAAYYQRYGRASAAKAPLLARVMVGKVMGTWETCDDQSMEG